jgi:hypothetical protein
MLDEDGLVKRRSGPKNRPADETSRARARAERDERVDIIVGHMATGTWGGLRSARDLSLQWGVSIHAVNEYAREASGIVRSVVSGDPETIRSAILAGIENVERTALTLVKHVQTGHRQYEPVVAPDCAAALRGYELRLKTLGLIVDKHEVKVAEPTDEEFDARAIEWLTSRGYEVSKKP